MGLNPSEQMVFDYLQTHPEERHHWIAKVQTMMMAKGGTADHVAVGWLEGELWRYFEERSGVASPFRELAQREGVRRTSMRNLAEYLLRLWVKPRPPIAPPPA